jgi:hypothetical protein
MTGEDARHSILRSNGPLDSRGHLHPSRKKPSVLGSPAAVPTRFVCRIGPNFVSVGCGALQRNKPNHRGHREHRGTPITNSLRAHESRPNATRGVGPSLQRASEGETPSRQPAGCRRYTTRFDLTALLDPIASYRPACAAMVELDRI